MTYGIENNNENNAVEAYYVSLTHARPRSIVPTHSRLLQIMCCLPDKFLS